MSVDDLKVSDEDKLKAATSFLQCAPLAEYKQVYKEVSTLLNDGDILGKAVDQVHSSWETRIAPIVDKDKKRLITSTGKISDGVYAAPRTGEAFTVDFAKQAITTTRDLSDAEKSKMGVDDDTRGKLQEALDAYMADHMDPHGNGEVFKDGDNYVICIHSDNAKMSAFWTGNWTSQATIYPDEEKIEMSTRVQVHYWEDGNVQMNSTHKSTSKVKKGDKMVESAIKALADFLLTYHSAVSKAYIQMDTSTFKNLRRKLPITKQKIAWNKLEQYKIGKETAAS